MNGSRLRIVHVFRAPLGGLFRHVVDLAREQSARGHQVGMFFDSGGMEARVEAALAGIPGGLPLGVGLDARYPRNPGLSEISALLKFSAMARQRGARRRARSWRQGRPAGAPRGRLPSVRRGDRSSPTRRTAAASTIGSAALRTRLYMGAERALARQDGSVPVRERFHRRTVRAVRAARHGACRCAPTMDCGPRNSSESPCSPTPPNCSTSANCVRRKASTR